MKILKSKTYETMSQKGCEILIETIQKKKNARICLATGSTPKRMYELFVKEVNTTHLDISQVTFVKLDEWYGITPSNPSTCTSFIQEHLISKLNSPIKEFIEMQSNCDNVVEEIERMDRYLENHPIDLMILGLGMNGHLGLNEPASSLTLGCHHVLLDSKTKTHDMIQQQEIESGMTIGMKGIFESKCVLMLVSGANKEIACQRFLSGNITTEVPASLLWLHQNCISVVDEEQFTKM